MSEAVRERGLDLPASIDREGLVALPVSRERAIWWTEEGLDRYIVSGLQEWECGLFPRDTMVQIIDTDLGLYPGALYAAFPPGTHFQAAEISVDALMEQLGGSVAFDKVVAYVTREREGRKELLVFEHGDYPEIEPHVPGGGVEEGETPHDALRRELWEESGITDYVARKLCDYAFYKLFMKQFQRRHVYEITPGAPLPDSWVHEVTGHDEDASEHFIYRWIDVAEAEGLLGARLADKVHLL